MGPDPANRESRKWSLHIDYQSEREGRPDSGGSGRWLGLLVRFLRRLMGWHTVVSAVLAMALSVAPQRSADRDLQQAVRTERGGHHSLMPRNGFVIAADAISDARIFSSADRRDQVTYVMAGRVAVSSTGISGPARVVVGDSLVAIVSGDADIDLRDRDHARITQLSGSSELRPLPGSSYAVLCEQLRKGCAQRGVILYHDQQIETAEHPRSIAQARTMTAPGESTDVTAWRRGYMVFSGSPLGVVAQEFQRYYDVEFDIDPAASSRLISGQFPTDPYVSNSGRVLDPIDGPKQLVSMLYPDLRVTLHTAPDGHRTLRIRKKSGHPG